MSSPTPRQDAVSRLIRDIEQHVSLDGWDRPARLFAVVRIADALARDPGLASRLDPEVVASATDDPEYLMAVEQDELPEGDDPAQILAQVSWPPSVDGAALVLERLVLPSSAEGDLPQDPQAAAEAIAQHPDRHDLRLAAACMRDGTGACALRSRAHDGAPFVSVGPDLVPALLEALRTTFEND